MFIQRLTAVFFLSLIFCEQSVLGDTSKEDCSSLVRTIVQSVKKGVGLKKHLPYFYFFPFPRFIKKLDFDLVDLKKEEYLQGLKTLSLSIPKSNEEKLALVEAIIEFVSHNPKNSEDFASSFRERQRKVAKLLNKWKPLEKLLSPEKFKKIIDQHYLQNHSSFFQIKHTGRMFHPSESLAKMARLRWEHEVVKQNSLKSMRELGMVQNVEYTRERYKNAFGSIFKLLTFYETPSFYNFWLVRNKVETMARAAKTPRSSEEAFLEFQKKFRKLEIVEFYKNSTVPFIPYAFIGFIAFTTYEQIQEIREMVRLQRALEPLNGLVSREEIEEWLMLHFNVRVEGVLGEPPPQDEQQEFKVYLASLKLVELNDMKEKVESGDLRPLFRAIIQDSMSHDGPRAF